MFLWTLESREVMNARKTLKSGDRMERFKRRQVASAKADRGGCFGKEETFDLSPELWEERRWGEGRILRRREPVHRPWAQNKASSRRREQPSAAKQVGEWWTAWYKVTEDMHTFV